jgi:hypothetical protein
LKKKSDNPVHDAIGDKLFRPDLDGMVSRKEYEAKVAEISGLKRQVSDLQGVIDDDDNYDKEPRQYDREPRW